MAPIDPAQLLKALDSLLSVEGGIKSIDDVPRLASMKWLLDEVCSLSTVYSELIFTSLSVIGSLALVLSLSFCFSLMYADSI